MTNEIKGVAMNSPSPLMASQIEKSVNDFFGNRKGINGGLLVVATTEGANLVLAKKINDKFYVTTHIGKKWGAPLEGGISAVTYF